MTQEEMLGSLEAILFVYADPIAPKELSKALELSEAEIREGIQLLSQQYEQQKKGLMLRWINDGVQLCSNPIYASSIERLFASPKTKNLSKSVLETLSIIAYKQPITRAEIEEIRGVRCEYAINQLLEQGLIIETGKKQTIGRPSLFATTDRFLQIFGLESLEGLPPINHQNEIESFGVV